MSTHISSFLLRSYCCEVSPAFVSQLGSGSHWIWIQKYVCIINEVASQLHLGSTWVWVPTTLVFWMSLLYSCNQFQTIFGFHLCQGFICVWVPPVFDLCLCLGSKNNYVPSVFGLDGLDQPRVPPVFKFHQCLCSTCVLVLCVFVFQLCLCLIFVTVPTASSFSSFCFCMSNFYLFSNYFDFFVYFLSFNQLFRLFIWNFKWNISSFQPFCSQLLTFFLL